MTSRQTSWLVLIYAWLVLGAVFALGGRDGGPLEIAAFAVFLGLVAFDMVTYARTHPDADSWWATRWRTILLLCVAVAPLAILAQVV